MSCSLLCAPTMLCSVWNLEILCCSTLHADGLPDSEVFGGQICVLFIFKPQYLKSGEAYNVHSINMEHWMNGWMDKWIGWWVSKGFLSNDCPIKYTVVNVKIKDIPVAQWSLAQHYTEWCYHFNSSMCECE